MLDLFCIYGEVGYCHEEDHDAFDNIIVTAFSLCNEIAL